MASAKNGASRIGMENSGGRSKSKSRIKIMKRIRSRRKIRSQIGGGRPENRHGRYNRLSR
jgi:hypothetical protein